MALSDDVASFKEIDVLGNRNPETEGKSPEPDQTLMNEVRKYLDIAKNKAWLESKLRRTERDPSKRDDLRQKIFYKTTKLINGASTIRQAVGAAVKYEIRDWIKNEIQYKNRNPLILDNPVMSEKVVDRVSDDTFRGQTENETILRICKSNLTEYQQKLLIMRYEKDMSSTAIAEELCSNGLAVTSDQVDKYLFNIRQELKEIMLPRLRQLRSIYGETTTNSCRSRFSMNDTFQIKGIEILNPNEVSYSSDPANEKETGENYDYRVQ